MDRSIVFFYCAATAIDNIKKAYREAKKVGNSEFIEFAEKEIKLYEKFIGKDYIEVHHKTPLSVNGNEVVYTEAEIENALVCICANCHRMIHRQKGVIITVEELKERFKNLL